MNKYLIALENQSISIIREAVATAKNFPHYAKLYRRGNNIFGIIG